MPVLQQLNRRGLDPKRQALAQGVQGAFGSLAQGLQSYGLL